MVRNKTKYQTHVRIAQADKRRLEAFMKRNGYKSQAAALRAVFRKARL